MQCYSVSKTLKIVLRGGSFSFLSLTKVRENVKTKKFFRLSAMKQCHESN